MPKVQSQQQYGVPVSLPAPVGGFNTRDSLASMKPLYAVQLDNLYPIGGECRLRGGATVLSYNANPVKSLYQYSATTGNPKLFAVTDSGIYDAGSAGAFPAVSQALTNGYWNAVLFTNSAGTTYLWGLNGTDSAKMYNGTAWSTPTITGATTSACNSPFVFKRRIFFMSGMSLWYLPIDSIQGTANEFPVGQLFKRGGYLVAGTSWTIDGGDGIDDLLVLITSEGEVAVYKGTDISSASSWSLVGVYYIGKPIGRRCFQRLGGDVAVLTEAGCFPLSSALTSAIVNYDKAITDLIRPTYLDQVRGYGTTVGWEICIYPAQNALIINVPTKGQLVMNTATGAWCSFSGLSTVLCMCLFNGLVYAGDSTGTVRQIWSDVSFGDQTTYLGTLTDVVGTCQTSFNYLGKSPGLKKPTMFRPQLSYDESLEVRWGIAVDYKTPAINSVNPRTGTAIGAVWDVSPWDTTPWSTTTRRQNNWRAVSTPPGYAISLLLQIATTSGSVSWSGTDFLGLGAGAM